MRCLGNIVRSQTKRQSVPLGNSGRRAKFTSQIVKFISECYQMPQSIVFNQTLDNALTLLEEGARASDRSVPRFIEPMQGTIRRAESKRHHIIFGRRGSGKSSLLHKTANILHEKNYPVAFVDLERFKGHLYPDLLLSVLIAAFVECDSWLEQYLEQNKAKWHLLFKSPKQFHESNDQTRVITHLRSTLKSHIEALKKELHSSDHSTVSTKTDNNVTRHVDIRMSVSTGVEQSTQEFRSEEFSRTKIDFLHRTILDYQNIFATMSKLTQSDCYLFLDDLYHIARSDQPKLLDYIHRIAKGHHLWLKIGTIKFRSTWYLPGAPPIGLKLADDADDIDLDQTLEKYSTTKQFLTNILDQYLREANAPERDDLISETGLERLAIASGGVPRDFLGLFRRAVDEARNRLNTNPNHPRGQKIGAEDVNAGAGKYGESKREELNRDVSEDQEILASTLEKIASFCLDEGNANIFLVEQDIDSEDHQRINELIDLRLIHHVKSRVTVRDRPKKSYRALLLDVSQYTGERKRRGIKMIEFWKEGQELRNASWIYSPMNSVPERFE